MQPGAAGDSSVLHQSAGKYRRNTHDNQHGARRVANGPLADRTHRIPTRHAADPSHHLAPAQPQPSNSLQQDDGLTGARAIPASGRSWPRSSRARSPLRRPPSHRRTAVPHRDVQTGGASVGDGDPPGRAVDADQPAVRDHHLRVGVAEVDVEDRHGVRRVVGQCPQDGGALLGAVALACTGFRPYSSASLRKPSSYGSGSTSGRPTAGERMATRSPGLGLAG